MACSGPLSAACAFVAALRRRMEGPGHAWHLQSVICERSRHRVQGANLGAKGRKLLVMAVAGAPRRLAVANAPQQLPPLVGLQPGRIWVAQVDHWAAPLALLDALSAFTGTISIPRHNCKGNLREMCIVQPSPRQL